MLHGEKDLLFMGAGTVIVMLLLFMVYRPLAKARRRKKMLARRGPTPSNITWAKPFDPKVYRNLPMVHPDPESSQQESYEEVMARLREDHRRWDEEDSHVVARIEAEMKGDAREKSHTSDQIETTGGESDDSANHVRG